MQTLRLHIGDENFFNLLKHWTYALQPANKDNGICKIYTTNDMKEIAENFLNIDLDPFFNVFFREANFPTLNVERSSTEARINWQTEGNILLDLNVPISINGVDDLVVMEAGAGSIAIAEEDELKVDPDKWILMKKAVITGIAEDGHNNLKSGIELRQNYPNPFNLTTNISFSIPNSCKTSLSIYNIQGQLVKELVNKSLNAGEHSLEFDASSFNSGVYYYTLKMTDKSITKKMILVK